MRWLVAALIATSFAGCVSTTPVLFDDPSVTIAGLLVTSEGEEPIEGARITLQGVGLQEVITNGTGEFSFNVLPGACTLIANATGFVEGTFATQCDRNRYITIRLGVVMPEVEPPVHVEVPAAPPAAPTFVLSGNVQDGEGAPMSATVSLLLAGDVLATQLTKDGRFSFQLPAGEYELQAERDCAAPVAATVSLQNHTAVNLVLADAVTTTPPAPTGLETIPGPGPGMVTLRWDSLVAEPPVRHYTILRDGQPFMEIGNAQAWADTTPDGHEYALAATNICGLLGDATQAVSGTPLPGFEALIDVNVRPGTGIKTTTQSFTVLNAAHEEIGTRDFRAVQGVGNCCETYVAADKSGRVYEYGGTYIQYSDDQGETWNEVTTPTPQLGAEGAIVQAPGGDVVAFNWSPYTGDQLWVHKYVAALDAWYYQQVPLHQPFYDRPWIAVVEGPFEIDGIVAPYVTFVMSNYVHADVMQYSLDGLNFVAMTQRSATQLGGTVSTNWDLPVDPERDWIQAMRETFIVPIDDGQGLRGRALLSYCDWAALGSDLLWGCANFGTMPSDIPNEDSIRVDSKGHIHRISATAGETSFTLRTSQDAGKTWHKVTANIPRDMVIEDWDTKVHGGLDQLVVSVRASESIDASTIDQDMLFRFAGLDAEPYLKEIILVGAGDHVFGGGLTSEYDRFDYTTVTLLPSGAASLSFGDSTHNPPAIAIEIV